MDIKKCSFPPESGACDFLLRLLMKWPVSKDELFQLLQIRCCDVNLQNSSGMSPLKAAVMNCDADIIIKLVDFGAEVTAEILEFSKTKYPHKPYVFAVLEKIDLKQRLERNLPNEQQRGKSMKL